MKHKFIFTSGKELSKFLNFVDQCSGFVDVQLEDKSDNVDTFSTISLLTKIKDKPVIVTIENRQDEINFLKMYEDD